MGGKTYVVSIPSEYIRKYNLKKGDELFFEDKGSNLIFRNDKAKTAEKLSITLKDQDNIERVLKSLYERGYDEIEITLENRPLALENILIQLPGFEMVQSGKNSCIIKCISNVCTEEFENMLKRLLLMIRSIPETIQLDKKDAPLKIATAKRLALICKRCLSKKEFQNYNRTLIYYTLLNEIEGILYCYETVIKDKAIPFKELLTAAEAAYDALYKKEPLEELKISQIIKSGPHIAAIGLGISKIITLAQSLKVA